MRSLGAFAVCAVVLAAASCGSDGGGHHDGGSTGSAGGLGGADGSGGETTGGQGIGGDVTAELELIDRYPGAGDDNAWTGRPITLTFSKPIDPDTVEESILVQLKGQEIEHTSEVSSDGVTVTVTLEAGLTLPASISIRVSADLKAVDGDAFAGDSWTFTYPLWQSPRGDLPTAPADVEGAVAVSADSQGRTIVVYPSADGLSAARDAGGSWYALPSPPVSDPTKPAVIFGSATDPLGKFVVGWVEGSSTQSARVARFDGDEWELLGDDPVATGADLMPSLAIDVETVRVAVQSSAGTVSVFGSDGGPWQLEGSAWAVPGGSIHGLALAGGGANLAVAVIDGAYDVVVGDYDGGWGTVGGTIDRSKNDVPPLQLVRDGNDLVVAYVDGDELSNHVIVQRYAGSWAGSAVDLDIDAEATMPTLLPTSDGVAVAWREAWAGKTRAFVAYLDDAGRTIWGTELGGMPSAPLALGEDSSNFLHVAWLGGPDGIEARRQNDTDGLPVGVVRGSERGTCAIPEDDDPDFPETLSATGCYVNVAQREIVDAAIPFDINSVLWSDGALKRRYLLLPDGGTVDYVSAGAFGMPVGTIVIKEFYVEKAKGDPSVLIPMETRFLVKRCEEGACEQPWQGYSYEWNVGGNEGTLLDNPSDITREWPITVGGEPAMHTHSYPSRGSCLTCHNSSGRVLGLRANQLNKAFDYDGIVDHQLQAWTKAGLFGDTAPETPAEEDVALPRPPDVSASLEGRSRSYFQANCAHCHNPGGSQFTVDFRWETSLAMTGLCSESLADPEGRTIVVPGDANDSPLYLKDASRVGGTVPPYGSQMPTLATLLTDDRQLKVTKAWIDSLATCP